jgi:ribA/ribD-fused uncharacterized protein
MIDYDVLKEVNITDDYVAFWGSVFSNFYPCDIHVTEDWWGNKIDIHFSSSEQYFMWLKATEFADYETAEKILKTKTPKEAKKLGREVKNFDDEEWHEVREAAMWNAVWLKFSQNEDLKKIITDPIFSRKSFVEGNPVDKIWGAGLVWNDPKIADSKNWSGLNLLGKTLDKVRRQLLSDEKD